MKKTIISRIYLENYKLFEHLNIDLESELNIFDGPNGYGKTSIFDAIEFIITGDIKRITNSSVLDGKYSYGSFVFAKEPNKDVIIKAEIKTNDGCITIAKKISGNISVKKSGKNNPKKLVDITKTYILPEYESIDLLDEYELNSEKQKELQDKYFGEISQSLYELLYYVQQEDRLDYFKRNEKDRLGRINALFKTEDECIKRENISKSKRKLNSLIKELENEIEIIRKNVDASFKNIPGHDVIYRKLFTNDVAWDSEKPIIKSKDDLNEAIFILERLSSYLLYKNQYAINMKNIKIDQFMGVADRKSFEAYIMLKNIGERYSKYIMEKKKLKFVYEVLHLVEQSNFVNIDFDKVVEYFGTQAEIDEIKGYLRIYQQINESNNNSRSTIDELFKIRESLIYLDKSKLSIDESKCPYCGHNWKEQVELNKQIERTTTELRKLLGDSERRLYEIKNNISKIFNEKIKNHLDVYIDRCKKDSLFIKFYEFDNNDLDLKNKYVENFLNENEVIISENNLDKSIEEQIDLLTSKIRNKVVALSEEYNIANKQYKFQELLKDYFNDINELDIQNIDIKEKENYMRYHYYVYQQSNTKKIQILENQLTILKSSIFNAIDTYEQDLKNCISKYIGDIISKIEIPFYLYSARILQSYQGGQGIIIREAQKEGIETIRFTRPGGEHDILYTMSSGQLSGILLAYSLILNKMFANYGLNAILIDDPVQCMDELNMMSFVELIRTEFSKVQIIISTHEDTFANYISYKYKKCNLNSKRHNLQALVQKAI